MTAKLDPTDETVRVDVTMPSRLKSQFRQWCEEHGTDMTTQLRKWIEKAVKK